jgi:histidinol-phosphate aminotransferase
VSVRFNSRISSIPGYTPGVPKGKSATEVASSNLAQLASNESPFPPLPEVVAAVADAAASMNRYPDPMATDLREVLAQRDGVDPSEVLVANGSCEVLLGAAETVLEPGTSVVYSWPAFSMYPILAPLSGSDEIRVPLADGDVHDLDAMLGALTEATRLVLVCNPNNPTATYRDADSIARFVEAVPEDVTVILDEAYIDFDTGDDPAASIELFRRHRNVVILRTFSKAHSLAGFRVGYAICSPAFRAAIEAVRQPFSVNALAQVAALESMRHADVIAERIATVVAERERIQSALGALGLECTDSKTNFSWVSLGEGGAGIEDRVVSELAGAGIVVRPGGLLGGPGHLRISYGTAEENDRMIQSLEASLRD